MKRMPFVLVFVLATLLLSCQQSQIIEVYETGDKYGYFDTTGKVVIEPVFEHAHDFSDGLAGVGISDSEYGYIDKNGKMVIAPNFYYVYPFCQGRATVNIGGEFAVIDKSGNIVNNSGDEWISFSEGLAYQKFEDDEGNRKYGFINRAGEIVIEPKFDDASYFSEGLAAIEVDGKWGFINKDGKIVIQPIYDRAYGFSEGLACVQFGTVGIDGQCGFIDKTGEMVIEPVFINAYSFSDGLASVTCGSNVKSGYIDKTGKMVIEPVYSFAASFSDGLARVEKDGRYCFIDKLGKIVLEPTYPIVEDFSEGLCRFYIGRKYGLMDENGSHITESIYDELLSDGNGLFIARIDDNYGVIDKRGETVIEFMYDQVSYSRGRYIVVLDDKFGLFDAKGKRIIEPKCCSIGELYGFELDDTDEYCKHLHNKEGFTIVDTMGLGPQNSRVTINDQLQRPLLLAGMASEAGIYNAIKYLYDEDGEIRGFLSFCNHALMPYYCVDDAYAGIVLNEDYINPSWGCDEIIYDMAMNTDERKPYYVRFNFERDEEERIVKVYDPLLHYSISAPNDGHFEYLVRENCNFWYSDIIGGGIDLLFITAPNDPENDYGFEIDTFYYYTQSFPEFF